MNERAREPTVCPISPVCSSLDQLRAEAERIRRDLDRPVEDGGTTLSGIEPPGSPAFSSSRYDAETALLGD